MVSLFDPYKIPRQGASLAEWDEWLARLVEAAHRSVNPWQRRLKESAQAQLHGLVRAGAITRHVSQEGVVDYKTNLEITTMFTDGSPLPKIETPGGR